MIRRAFQSCISLLASFAVLAQGEPVAGNSAAGGDSISFKNGDLLKGMLEAIDPANGIQWHRADALNDFRFTPEMISEIEFAPSGEPDVDPSSNFSALHLSNGDVLEGNLLGADGQTVRLNTWYGGTLEFPRAAVSMILPLGIPKPALFQGPAGLEGWTMGKVNAAAVIESGEWIFQNNAFYGVKPASIARDLNLPDSSSLQFDLDWRGFFHIAVALYTEYLQPINLTSKESEPQFGGFYSLQINPFSANLLPVKQNEALRYLGQAPLQNLAQTNSARIDIRASKSKRLIALLINGVLVKQWNDTEEFAGSGTAVRFVHQGQGAVKISNIRVYEWDGQFEEPAVVTPNKTQDLARLKNGDRVIGNIHSITNGTLKFEAAGQVLDIPVARVKQMEYAVAKPVPPVFGPHTVRAYFASGTGSLTFDLESWTREKATVQSPAFGAATMDPQAFSRLVFDAGSPEKKTK